MSRSPGRLFEWSRFRDSASGDLLTLVRNVHFTYEYYLITGRVSTRSVWSTRNRQSCAASNADTVMRCRGPWIQIISRGRIAGAVIACELTIAASYSRRLVRRVGPCCHWPRHVCDDVLDDQCSNSASEQFPSARTVAVRPSQSTR